MSNLSFARINKGEFMFLLSSILFHSVPKDNCTFTLVIFALKYVSIYAKEDLRRGSGATRFLWLQFQIPGGYGSFSVVNAVCCRVDISATGRSLVQWSSTECGVSKYDTETSTTTRLRSTRLVEPRKNAKENENSVLNYRVFQVAASWNLYKKSYEI